MLSARLSKEISPNRTMGELFNLSQNIRRMRLERGWSIRELARRLDTHHPTVVRWEQPVTEMSVTSLRKLADVFGVTMVDLLSEPRINYTPTHVSYASFSSEDS